MSDLDALLQNISDITTETTTTIATVTALVSSIIAFGDKAYPYAKKVIDAVIDLYKELGDGYEILVAILEKLKKDIETKLAEAGIITIEDLDDFMAKIEAMHANQLSSESKE